MPIIENWNLPFITVLSLSISFSFHRTYHVSTNTGFVTFGHNLQYLHRPHDSWQTLYMDLTSQSGDHEEYGAWSPFTSIFRVKAMQVQHPTCFCWFLTRHNLQPQRLKKNIFLWNFRLSLSYATLQPKRLSSFYTQFVGMLGIYLNTKLHMHRTMR